MLFARGSARGESRPGSPASSEKPRVFEERADVVAQDFPPIVQEEPTAAVVPVEAAVVPDRLDEPPVVVHEHPQRKKGVTFDYVCHRSDTRQAWIESLPTSPLGEPPMIPRCYRVNAMFEWDSDSDIDYESISDLVAFKVCAKYASAVGNLRFYLER